MTDGSVMLDDRQRRLSKRTYQSRINKFSSFAVRFDFSCVGIGTVAFIELPQSSTSAAESGWVKKTRPDGPVGLASLELWCHKDDYSVCVLLDDTGYIAGLQIAVSIFLLLLKSNHLASLV